MLNLRSHRLERWLTAFVLLLFIALFFLHLYIIQKYAVNIPYVDDWVIFQDDHPASLSIPWLLDATNMRPTPSEHVIATTKLFVWVQFHLNGWNYPVNLVLNFLIYGLFLCGIFRLAHEAVPALPQYIKWAFMIFLLSPINWLNHFMATQSCFRFYLIFFFLGTCLLFRKEQLWLHILAGSVSCMLSIYSLASGFGSCLILLIAFCIFKGMRITSKSSAAHRIHEIFHVVVAVFLIGGTMLFWISRYATPPEDRLVFPNDLGFWRYFLNLMSFGFGIDRLSWRWGIICLLIVILPICHAVWKRNLTTTQWACGIIVAGILVNIAEIAIGRTSRSAIHGPKSIRYVEFVLPLIPLSMINWAVVLQHRKLLQIFAVAGLCFFCTFTLSDNWSFEPYRGAAASRTEGRQCVKAYYKGVGDGRCPTLYPVDNFHIPLSTWLEGARRVKASFYDEIRVEIENEK